ncbi:MAG: hypothetical protein U1B78_00680, partial [Dehalococcoidia bacterium]|nr:hypothetical protein [Dehalococcoidia bacterium]
NGLHGNVGATFRSPAALVALLAFVLAAACGGGDGDDGGPTQTPGDAGTVEPSGDFAGEDGCVDPELLPQAVAPWEVGSEPIFFRFGLPEEALQSGDVCPQNLGLVAIRVVGEGDAEEPPVLTVSNRDTDEQLEVPTERVTVPGEEDAGTFFNAVVELPGPGRWDFSVEVAGGSATYRVPVREPE